MTPHHRILAYAVICGMLAIWLLVFALGPCIKQKLDIKDETPPEVEPDHSVPPGIGKPWDGP